VPKRLVSLGSTKRPLRILVADGVSTRLQSFRLTGKDFILGLRDTLSQTLLEINGGTWDLIITSNFFSGSLNSVEELAKAMVKAYHEQRLRGVICISTIQTDAKKTMKTLKDGGVPATWIPFDYSNPRNHTRRDSELNG
jgi:hypothetical protein